MKQLQSPVIQYFGLLSLLGIFFLLSCQSGTADTLGATNYEDPAGYPGSWPSSWTPYTVQGESLEDQTNGGGDSTKGAAPTNESDVAPCGGESVFLDRDLNNIYFRICLNGNPSGDNTDPFTASGSWSLLIDVDGDGYREFVISLDGKSSQSFDNAPDNLYVLYKNDQRQDFLDSDLQSGTGQNATIGNAVLWVQDSAQGNPVTSVDGESNWKVSESGGIRDFKRTRVVNNNDGTYYLDIQVPLTALDATNLGGTKIDASTPISLAFATANSNTDPAQKDIAYPGNFTPQPDQMLPFGDLVGGDGTQDEPIINSVTGGSCGASSSISAQVIDSLKLENNVFVSSIGQVEFFYYADLNDDGIANDGQSWISIGNGALDDTTVNPWKITWDTTSLVKGKYLLKAIATDTQATPNIVDSAESDNTDVNYNSATNGDNPIVGNLNNDDCGLGLDYGDAPANYDDTVNDDVIDSNDNPARHIITSNLYYGRVAPDDETTPQSSANADDDDNTGENDDEEGINSFTALNSNANSYSLTATVENASDSAANVYGWIDFDGDGEFDEDERAIVADDTISLINGQVPSGGSGTVTLNWSNLNNSGANIVSGNSYIRIRLATDELDQTTETTERDDASVGMANNGEVEDYPITISEASTSLCPTTKADLWFANDESGSVDDAEFKNSLDFIYQVSDQFEYGEIAGIKAGIIGWASNTPTIANHIIIPITDTFSDPEDTGLIANNNISTDGDNQGVREIYTNKVASSTGTRLDLATNYLADLIILKTANGGRTNTPQIAIILTDANLSQITDVSSGGGSGWTAAADKLKDIAGASIVLIIIDEAADAYNSNIEVRNTVDTVVGVNGKLLVVPTYTEAADATQQHVVTTAQAICDSTNPIATSPELVLTKRITAINPGQAEEVSFTNFVDDTSNEDNNSNWPDSTEENGNLTNTYTVGEIDGGQVKPEDVLEYTIYFLSSGDETASNVLVCDLIPENIEFVPRGFEAESPAAGGLPGAERGLLWEYNGNLESLTNGNDGDVGYYFPPGVEPGSVFPDIKCSEPSQPNTNGAVVVNLGNLPPATASGTPTNSYGLIRFRGKVK